MTSFPASAAQTGRRLGVLLVGYLVAMVLVITLAPFEIDPGRGARFQWIVLDGGWLSDLLLNVVLFVPIGVAAHRTFGRSMSRVLLGALVASTTIEALQLVIVPRYPTVSDIAANTLGAAVGAGLSAYADARLGSGRDLVGRLLLDLPLMGVVYLLVPLLWLDGLGAAGNPARAWLLVPIAAAGSITLAAVARTIPGAAHTRVGRNVVGGAALWCVIGVAPALRSNPTAAGAACAVAVVLAAVAQRGWMMAARRDRRIEPQVVRVVLPILLAYVAVIALHPGLLLLEDPDIDARLSILQWLEQTAGFATVAYLIAEWRGRREEGELLSLVVPLSAVLVTSVIAVSIGHGDTIAVDVIAAVAAAAFGATLYRRQRDHIVALSRGGAEPEASPTTL